jgi:colanic acid biosynthesis glycosyl transferase WcaI
MRIALVSDRYAPEARAAAVLASTLAGELARRGHEVTVYCRRPTQYVPGEAPAPDTEVLQGVRVRRIGPLTGSRRVALRLLDQAFVAVRLLWTLLRDRQPDAWFVYSPPLLLVIPVLLAALLGRRPVVLNLHDLYPQAAIDLGALHNPVLIGIARLVERWLYRQASRILVAAPSSMRILREQHGVPGHKLALLWNWATPGPHAEAPRDNEFRRRLGVGEEMVVLYAGLMGLAQDLDVVLEAARALEHERDWKFVFVGDGPRAEEWRQRSAALHNVVFSGPVDPETYSLALRASDICLAPLHRDFQAPAVPGKVSSILACGRPLVACVPPSNDTNELLRESQAGIAVPAGDLAALQKALLELGDSPRLRDEMGAHGRHWAQRHFTLEAAATQCESALAQAGAAREPSLWSRSYS